MRRITTSSTSNAARFRTPTWLHWLVVNQFWVAAGAGVQSGISCLYLWESGRLPASTAGLYAAAVFGATLLFYRYLRLHSFAFRQNARWLGVLALSLTFLALLRLGLRWWLGLSLVALLAAAYAFRTAGWKRLRDLLWVKAFWLAVCWTGVTYLLPAWIAEQLDFWLALARFGFFWSLALAFDLADVGRDSQQGLTTLAHRLTRANAVLLITGAAVASLLIHASLLTDDPSPVNVAWTLSGAMFLVALVPAFRVYTPPRAYFDVVLDGVLILAGVIYLGLFAITVR